MVNNESSNILPDGFGTCQPSGTKNASTSRDHGPTSSRFSVDQRLVPADDGQEGCSQGCTVWGRSDLSRCPLRTENRELRTWFCKRVARGPQRSAHCSLRTENRELGF